MREGMVLEIYRDHVIVLTKSGEFLKLRKKGNVNIGDLYKEKLFRRFSFQYYAAAAVLIFILTSFAGYHAYAHQIVGYVDITGSKNVRLYVNRQGNIEKVDGLASKKEIKNLPLEKALDEIKVLAPSEGIYSSDEQLTITSQKIKPSKLDFAQISNKVKGIMATVGNKPNNNGNGSNNGKGNGNSNNSGGSNGNGNGNGSSNENSNSNSDNNKPKGNGTSNHGQGNVNKDTNNGNKNGNDEGNKDNNGNGNGNGNGDGKGKGNGNGNNNDNKGGYKHNNSIRPMYQFERQDSKK